MIDIQTIDNFSPGLISSIVKKCYQGLIDAFPKEKDRLYQQWDKDDILAFTNKETIGKSVRFTCNNLIPVGYFSWDLRHYPSAIIGQNCILPEFRHQGIGKVQLEYMIAYFKEREFKEIKAITGDHNFFAAAQKMYTSFGFKETNKIQSDLFKLIEYTLAI
jgi:GNAT superfamily N-acetyltransferase